MAERCADRMLWLINKGYSGIGKNEGVLADAGVIFGHSSGKFGISESTYNSKAYKEIAAYDLETFIHLVDLLKENYGINLYTLNQFYTELGFGDDSDLASLCKIDPLSDEMIQQYQNNIGNDGYINYPLLTRIARAYPINCRGLKVTGGVVTLDDVEKWLTDVITKISIKLIVLELKKDDKYIVNGKLTFHDSDMFKDLAQYMPQIEGLFSNGLIVSRRSVNSVKSSSGSDIEAAYGFTLKMALPPNKFGENVRDNFDTFRLELQNKMGLYDEISADIDDDGNTIPEEDRYVKKPISLSGTNKGSQGLYQIDICWDFEGSEKHNIIPAADALDGILKSGKRPSWSNALLGELSNGEPFFWDNFNSKSNPIEKRVYHIYAGSRSGKGILTTSLLSNAICDGYKILYLDGKPDSSIGLGQLAWAEGCEAPVFEGTRRGTGQFTPGQLEEYAPNRDINEATEFEKSIPNITELRKLTGQGYGQINCLLTYFKGIELAWRVIKHRASGGIDHTNDVDGKPGDWFIVILDEIKEIASREDKIDKGFIAYIKSKGYTVDKETNMITAKKGATEDDTTKYIIHYFEWKKTIVSLIDSSENADLCASQTNVLTIFQGSSWIGNNSRIGGTSIIRAILRLKGAKVVGNNGIQNGAPAEYGNNTVKKYTWYSWIKPLQWIITKKAVVNECDTEQDVVKFKPFSLYGYTPEGQENNPLYCRPYMRILEEKYGFKSSQVLQDSWDYLENIVVDNHYADSLKTFMYDVTKFNAMTDSPSSVSTQPIRPQSGAANIKMNFGGNNNVTSLMKIADLQKLDEEQLNKYYNKFYRKCDQKLRQSASLLNFTSNSNIEASLLCIDNFCYLAETYGLNDYDQMLTLLQGRSDANSKIVAAIMTMTSSGQRQYDQMITKEELSTLLGINNNKSNNTSNRTTGTIHLDTKQAENIRKEIISIAKEMKANGEFNGLSKEDILDMIRVITNSVLNSYTEV